MGPEGRSVMKKRATIALAGENSTVKRTIKEADSLSQMTMETHGSHRGEYWEWVK